MGRKTINVPTTINTCDLCDEELTAEPEETGDLIYRHYATVAKEQQKKVKFTWPTKHKTGESRQDREKRLETHPTRTYEFHGACIYELLRDTIEGKKDNANDNR